MLLDICSYVACALLLLQQDMEMKGSSEKNIAEALFPH